MFKNMRDYTHEEFVELVMSLKEEELLELSANYGGYPVLFRMALDERIKHIPFIQTGSSVIVCNEKKEILLQKRSDNAKWGLPGGCQELGENLRETARRELLEETGISVLQNELILIDTLSGEERKRSYPNGDIVYNNTSLYFTKVNSKDIQIKKDSESLQLEFFSLGCLPNDLHDEDMIKVYMNYWENELCNIN